MFALPVRSQVFTGRVVCTPPRLAFVSYRALGLHRGLAKAKMFFSFSLMVCVSVCIVVSLYIGIVVNSFLDSSHNPVPQLMMSLPVDHPYTACTVCVFVLFAIMTKACLGYYAIHFFSTRVVLVCLFYNQRNIIPDGAKEEKPANLLISST